MSVARVNSLLDENVCAFCGQECSELSADLMREFHETFTLLVLADFGTSEHAAHLQEARRILDVALDTADPVGSENTPPRSRKDTE